MLINDFVYAARALRKSPAFTLTAMVTIALGIGASTEMGRESIDQDGVRQPVAPPTAPGQQQAAQPPRLPAIVILADAYWRKHFGADPNVVGRSIDFGNGKAQVVGVLAPGFELLFPPKAGLERLPDAWTALRLNPQTANRNNVCLRVVG